MLLFNTKSDNVFLKKLKHDIRETIGSKELLFCHSFEELKTALQTILSRIDIICLIANDPTELEKLLSLRHLLIDRNLIFVIPTGVEKSLFRKVFNVYPKYVGYLDETYFFITAVLAKMVQAKTFSVNKIMDDKQANPLTPKIGKIHD